MFSTTMIAVVGGGLLVGTIIPGLRLYWPQHHDPVSRTDLGVALMTGALVAFAILVLQLMIQIRSQHDADDRAALADRQNLLLVLSRSANLAGLDLSGQDVSSAYLSAKVLTGANLEHADLDHASLQDATLIGASLVGTSLEEANLERSDLRQATLVGANLKRAVLTGANLDTADLSSGENGETPVDLRNAVLSNASLRADLRGAILRGARLYGAKLAPANLADADLTGADLQYADLRGANLRGTNLRGALNMQDVKDLSYAVFDSRTTWPPGFIWDERTPTCAKRMCTLTLETDINDFPEGVNAIRAALAKATRAPGCLPGWWVDEQPFEISAHAPRGRATFSVATAVPPEGMTVSGWAAGFHDKRVKLIKELGVGGVPVHAYSYTRSQDGHSLDGVAVFFIRKKLGFHLWATAPPSQFPIFQRDFLKLFSAAGVQGNLFPSLREEKAACPA